MDSIRFGAGIKHREWVVQRYRHVRENFGAACTGWRTRQSSTEYHRCQSGWKYIRSKRSKTGETKNIVVCEFFRRHQSPIAYFCRASHLRGETADWLLLPFFLERLKIGWFRLRSDRLTLIIQDLNHWEQWKRFLQTNLIQNWSSLDQRNLHYSLFTKDETYILFEFEVINIQKFVLILKNITSKDFQV